MKQCVSCSWNTLFYGNETSWIRSNDHIDIVNSMLITNQIKLFSYIDFWFMVFRGVSWCYKLFHCPVSWCFKVFHCRVSSSFMTMKQVQLERVFMLFVHCCLSIVLSPLLTWRSTWPKVEICLSWNLFKKLSKVYCCYMQNCETFEK